MDQRILTYDSTLRDGEQSEGITLSLEDKLRIVERLDAFGAARRPPAGACRKTRR